MSDAFGRRLRDIVEGVRTELENHQQARGLDAAAARARRRHMEKVAGAEARNMTEEASGVFAGLGLRGTHTPEEIRVEPISGARIPEKHPPWFRISFREPAYEDTRVAVMEVSWRVDDPRTPLPEAPNTIRMVIDDDSPAGLAEVRDFLAVALEDFATSVVKYDTLPQA